MDMYNFLMMLWKAVFSVQSNVGKDTFDFITSEVFSLLPKSFLAILMLMWGGANGEMANLTNEKGKFAIAIFRHYSPFFAIFRHW